MTMPTKRAQGLKRMAAMAVLSGWLTGCAHLTPPLVEPTAPAIVATSPVLLPATPAAPAWPRAALEPDITINPLQPRMRLDPLQDAERGDLWQRLRDGYLMPDFESDLVHKWEQWYARDPAYVQRMTDRGGRYLFYIVEEVQRRGMPTELALLPFIESAFNPQAQSHARASGMWQFMPATGKDFELHQNLFRDDRRDVLASTRAALDYLQRLNTLFGGDWQLALAAYNWGQGNVQKALERNRRAGLPTDYASLRMPLETREYVPKLQAVKNIVARPDAFALRLQPLGNHPFFLSVTIDRDIDVVLAARLAGLPLEEFQQLNPQMNKPVILAAGTPQVLLPYDNANHFLRSLADHRGGMASWTAWVVPRTLKPAEAARLVGIDEAQLRQVNQIPPRMVVKAGSILLVPRGMRSTVDVAEHIADHAALALAPEARVVRRLSFKARPGETVAAVARRYRVSPGLVAQWNQVPAQGRFRAGQTVLVVVPAAAPKPAAVRLAKAAGKATEPTRVVKVVTPTRVVKAATSRKRAAAATPPRVRLAQASPR